MKIVRSYTVLLCSFILIFASCSSSPQKREINSNLNELSYFSLQPVEKEIILGMGLMDLRKVWGDPGEVLVSGPSQRKNQRWTYTEYIKSDSGYKKEVRYIYFESGKIIGWRTKSPSETR